MAFPLLPLRSRACGPSPGASMTGARSGSRRAACRRRPALARRWRVGAGGCAARGGSRRRLPRATGSYPGRTSLAQPAQVASQRRLARRASRHPRRRNRPGPPIADRAPAYVLLEDGAWFAGTAPLPFEPAYAEVVFTTNLSGYQEVFTDPSYLGQIVVMTAPMIGNYGINPEDVESDRPRVAGVIVRELSLFPSNWRATGSRSWRW